MPQRGIHLYPPPLLQLERREQPAPRAHRNGSTAVGAATTSASPLRHDQLQQPAYEAITNQAELWRGNAFTADVALQCSVRAFAGAAFAEKSNGNGEPAVGGFWRVLVEHGSWAGSDHTANLATQANEHKPVLRSLDRNGRRIDFVQYHPACE